MVCVEINLMFSNAKKRLKNFELKILINYIKIHEGNHLIFKISWHLPSYYILLRHHENKSKGIEYFC